MQGRKRALLGDEIYYYDALNYLTVSVTLPAIGHVLEATRGAAVSVFSVSSSTRALIGELLLQVGRSGVPPSTDRGLYVARTSPQLLDAVVRLTRLLEQPRDAAILAPLVMREIHYRVLTGELGHRLRELCVVDSQVQSHRSRHRAVAQAIHRIVAHRGPGRGRAYERVFVAPSFQSGDGDVADAIPEAAAPA